MKKLLVIFAAITLVVAFSLPAAAADWSFYGSSRMTTFFNSYDDDAAAPADGYSALTWDQQGNSRIGARVKTGDISGRFEYAGGDPIGKRLLYGEWDFGGGKLLLGQAYTPIAIFYSNQVAGGDYDLIGYGAAYGSRKPQIKLKFGNTNIAAITNANQGNADTMLPKIEASYHLSMDQFFADFQVGYQSYTDAADDSVSSTIVVVGGGGNFGQAYVRLSVMSGSNGGDAGWAGCNTGTADDATTTLGYIFVAGFKASDTMSFELGYGGLSNDSDAYGDPDTASSYYVQAVIALADTFFIVPEIGAFDEGEDNAGNTEGVNTYFGAKWQMNF